MDMTFDHAVAPTQSQGGQTRIFVSAEMPRECGKRRVLRIIAPVATKLEHSAFAACRRAIARLARWTPAQ